MNVIDEFDGVTTFDYPYENLESDTESAANNYNCWLDDFGWI